MLSSSFIKIVKTLKPIVDCTGNPRKIEVYVVFSQTLTNAARLMPSKWTDAIQMHLALMPRAHKTVLANLSILEMVLHVKDSLVFHEGDEIYILFPTLNVAVNWLRADFHPTFTSRRHKFTLPNAQKRNNFWLYMTINSHV